ncbi:MAG: thymidylate synthase [Candidatus Thiodiazotropha endolucinida]
MNKIEDLYIVEVKKDSLDDLLRNLLPKLLKSKETIITSRGPSFELDGVLLELSNPRARISRTEKRGTIFSCLGELLWYLSGTNSLDFIRYYIPAYSEESEDGTTIYGAYGPRLFNSPGGDQINNVITLLNNKPHSRRAVIQIFDSRDIEKNRQEIPCTCIMQFLIREKRLNMYTYMRSNDSFIGLPHDIFTFTMIQEIIARSLGTGMGKYVHTVGSLHLYLKNTVGVNEFMNEGWQENVSMPSMPERDLWPSISTLLEIEASLRAGIIVDIDRYNLDTYWSDLARLLLVYRHFKNHDYRKAITVRKSIGSDIYSLYIRTKVFPHIRKQAPPEQLPIPTM